MVTARVSTAPLVRTLKLLRFQWTHALASVLHPWESPREPFPSEQEGAVLSCTAGTTRRINPCDFPPAHHLLVLAASTPRALIVCWAQWVQLTGARLRNRTSAGSGLAACVKRNEFPGLELHRQPSELQWERSCPCLPCTFHWGARCCLATAAPPDVDDNVKLCGLLALRPACPCYLFP